MLLHQFLLYVLSPNNHKVQIYKKNGGQWVKVQELKDDHTITCGAHRNAYVWSQKDGVWKLTLVILRINHAPTFINKHIKKPVHSTALSLDWHPNVLLAVGSLDEKPASTPWGGKMPFSQLMSEYGGRAHGVSFLAGGSHLAWVSHNSTMSTADTSKSVQVSTLKMEFLPLLSVSFVSENSTVAAGHDCCPMLLDIPKQSIQRNMDKRAMTKDCNMALEMLHQNITQVSIYEVDNQDCCKFCTNGVDGAMTIWDFKTLESSSQGLRIM
ncbi:hypothetical protein FD755_001169 [Muntiacus reevesi]|uniref:Actin-related protein 2/3 complex subunit 1A n=1 Tax=Muntiacus reevesi TaxID=9886 RepID=A0A5J5N2N5_MUNRE|nr:hypothetical protein FD755_001169 [Muntiacus reevesi]